MNKIIDKLLVADPLMCIDDIIGLSNDINKYREVYKKKRNSET